MTTSYAEAKRKGEKVHMARVRGLIDEKNYQLREDDPARKFNGRGVLLGDQVKDQNMEAALFRQHSTQDGPIIMVAYLEMMCRWLMPYRQLLLHTH